MAGPVYLIYLDTYHLDDLLYLTRLAQVAGRRGQRPLCFFVHGSGGQAERLLEAEGLFPPRKDGRIMVQTEAEAALVERAVRQVNRRIVGELTDQRVHAVGFQGMDRGLLRWDSDGAMEAGALGWLEDLIGKRVVPVLSTLVRDPQTGQPCEVPLAAATITLAHALQAACVVVFLTRNDEPGIRDGEHVLRTLDPDRLPAAVLSEPGAVRAVVSSGIATLLTSAAGLYGADAPRGTWVGNVINGQY